MSKKVTYKDFLLLKAIPQKGKISTRQIVKALTNQGFELDTRTIQRDLNGLCEFFEIQSDKNKDTPGWSWKKDADKLELPSMSPDIALSFKMMQTYLTQFMPPSVLDALQPYLKQADKILKNIDNSISNWQDKINTTSRIFPLLPPEINPKHIEVIYSALLAEKQLTATYKPMQQAKKQYLIHPLGIVVIDQVLSLVATTWQYENILQFSLHRFITLEATDNPINKPKNFSLAAYIAQGNFLFPDKNTKPIKLVLKVNRYLYEYLSQSQLSKNQTTKTINDDVYEISAMVQLSAQLKWWLLSMGDDVAVLKPESLKKSMATRLKNACSQYQ